MIETLSWLPFILIQNFNTDLHVLRNIFSTLSLSYWSFRLCSERKSVVDPRTSNSISSPLLPLQARPHSSHLVMPQCFDLLTSRSRKLHIALRLQNVCLRSSLVRKERVPPAKAYTSGYRAPSALLSSSQRVAAVTSLPQMPTYGTLGASWEKQTPMQNVNPAGEKSVD